MKVQHYTSVTIRLEPAEQFTFETRTGLIKVSTIRADLDDKFPLLAGRAILKSGELGAINREDYCPIQNLPEHLRERIVRLMSKQFYIERLQDKDPE